MRSNFWTITAFVATLLTSVLLAASIFYLSLWPDKRVVIGLSAAALVGLSIYFGRRDLTRPQFLLPVVWFTAVAVAQFPLLNYGTEWSGSTVLVVFSAPAVFGLGATLIAGSSRWPQVEVSTRTLRVSRLRLNATLLFIVGLAGLVWKARLLGGVPLFSDTIDKLRSAGGIPVPAYVSFAVNCMTFSFWVFLLLIYLDKRTSARMSYGLAALAAFVALGSGASRNVMILALAVPVVFVMVTGGLRTVRASRIVLVVVLLFTISSGLFYVRIDQQKRSAFGSYFYSVVDSTGPAIRPLIPLYIGLSTPLETLNRVVRENPMQSEVPGGGQYFFPGLPSRINPFGGRADFYALTAGLSAPFYFNVATFAGSPYAEWGLIGTLLCSFFIGVLVGLLRWFVLSRASVGSVAVGAYFTYIVGFMLYEDMFTFYTLSLLWDPAVIWLTLKTVGVKPSLTASSSP